MHQVSFSALILIALFPLSAIASVVIVKEGETLSDIALKNNVSLSELIRVNKIVDYDYLKTGQKLILPEEKGASSPLLNKHEYKIVKGDTLNSIAIEFGVSQEKIISLNRLNDSDYLYEGQIIKMPNNQNSRSKYDIVTHKVLRGESIEGIAYKYKVNKSDIIIQNNILRPNDIFPDQELKIPINRKTKDQNTKNRKNFRDDITSHTISKGDTLISISKIYDIPIKKIIEINRINDPKGLKVGRKIFFHPQKNEVAKLQSTKKGTISESKNEWRSYGPLQIDWANWTFLRGSYVTPTINKKGKALYIAINCKAKKLNSTGVNGIWKDWIEPVDNFEIKLVSDICKERKGLN